MKIKYKLKKYKIRKDYKIGDRCISNPKDTEYGIYSGNYQSQGVWGTIDRLEDSTSGYKVHVTWDHGRSFFYNCNHILVPDEN